MGSVVIDMNMSLDGYIELEQTGLNQTDGVTHLEYRMVR
jgi:hypothetical protein